MNDTKNTASSSSAFSYRRKLQLLLSPQHAETLVKELKELPGMEQVHLKNDRQLVMRYDTAQLQMEQVLSVLEKMGATLDNNRWRQFRIGWYRFVDKNSQANARRKDVHCCNKPPVQIKRK
ncbi:hypothetical protein [Motiliproteus sp. MSK22-1]|uniref:hypothetical protein n=1 Tax=Motiliproteus sp. MSK22-1 TaxID=1897630 RepID=UPI000977ED1A|nr:hypothetical protein [Motiliproteus sp. MSK22-1]OMH31765.1 hypothetical protein BGP75_16755 [Motiliproteus sp. MSK22-1]